VLEEERQDKLAKETPAKPERRIDSADLKRESLFGAGSGPNENWLTEKVTGGGPGEQAEEMSEEDKATVTRRVVLGTLGTVGAVAFGLTPTEKLDLSRPDQPLFFYLVALLRIRELLPELEEPVREANFSAVKAGLRSILQSPNNARDNMTKAKLLLPDASRRARGDELIGSFIEYVRTVDYDQYFETVGPAQGGKQNDRYVDFSLKALKAAQRDLDEFLALMPREDLAAARQQLAPAFD